MKTMKKLLALLLALTMVFALATTASAAAGSGPNPADQKGKIEISAPSAGQTYYAYRLLALESWSDDTNVDPTPDENHGHYVYKLIPNSPWNDFIEDSGFFIIDENTNYVTWNKDTTLTAAQFAKDALDYAEDNDIDFDAQGGPLTAEEIAAGKIISMENLELGYYLVDTTLGALCSLGTTDNVAEILEKNEGISGDKKADDTDSIEVQWVGECTADIGEYVHYQVSINAKPGADNYTVHDAMSTGLVFVNDTAHPVTVYIDKDAKGLFEHDVNLTSSQYDLTTDVTHKIPGDATDPFEQGTEHTFDLAIHNDALTNIADGDIIYVEYYGLVTPAAIIYDGTNTMDNKMIISYGDGNKTTEKEAKTHSFKFNVIKKNEEGEALANAKFVLYKDYKDAELSNPVDLVPVTTPNVAGTTKESYKVCVLPENDHDDTKAGHEFEDHINTITTNKSGEFDILGLDAGTYYLKETDAPDGYNELQYPTKVVITDKGIVSFYEMKADGSDWETAKGGALQATLEVINKSGKEMPVTGGMGTTIFYVVGSVMMIGAAVILVAKKRTSI